MTDLEWVEIRIKSFEQLLRKAEATYHLAVTRGTMEDIRSTLSECQALRARLIRYMHQRDELKGGVHHAKNQR